MEFRGVDDANLALSTIHNHPFDARHTFKVNQFTDIDRYASVDETYNDPEVEEYIPRVSLFILSRTTLDFVLKEHLRAWLADPQGRDQYVTYRGDEVLIHWHGKPSQCEIAHKAVSAHHVVQSAVSYFYRNGETSYMCSGLLQARMSQHSIDKVSVSGVAHLGNLNNASPIRSSNSLISHPAKIISLLGLMNRS